jgi:hypothetical protein
MIILMFIQLCKIKSIKVSFPFLKRGAERAHPQGVWS